MKRKKVVSENSATAASAKNGVGDRAIFAPLAGVPTDVVRLRVSAREAAVLRAEAVQRGWSVSAYLRHVIGRAVDRSVV